MPEEILDTGVSVPLNTFLSSNSCCNLHLIEKTFGVKINLRDRRLKITSKEPSAIKRAALFIKEIIEFDAAGNELKNDTFGKILDAFQVNSTKELMTIFSERIKVGRKKEDIRPKTPKQFDYIRAIKERDIVFGIGPAGTGKTYLAMAMAVSEFLSGKFARIILTRPAREAGENLGFLPGTLEEKIMPYLRPLYDALYDMLDFEEVGRLMEKRIIEVAPLAFMRGRTLNHSFIILDEAQNTSPEQMLMFLTRIGFESKCVITGDPSQTDLGKNKVSGLNSAIKRLSKISEIAFVYFDSKDAVRHPLVEKIIEAYSSVKSTSER